MKDREFLTWIYARLMNFHAEDPNVDYMHKLLAVIEATPAEQETSSVVTPPTCAHGIRWPHACQPCADQSWAAELARSGPQPAVRT